MPRASGVSIVCALIVLTSGCVRGATPLPAAALPSPTPAPPVVFPRDAGPHDALTEWWYFTGHLQSARDGRAYGFEFTIFQARRQGAPAGYLSHFAVSDVDGQRFSHQARLAQGEAAGTFPLDVAGWRLGTQDGVDLIQAAMTPGAGADPPYALQLRLTDDKPPALHHGGYIDVGLGGGSYYYSRTRISVSGELRQGDRSPERVAGQAWMDHQWGNFVVSSAGGWDWYSLQLDDDSELMLYVLRSPDGATTSVYGSRIQPDGRVVDLSPSSVKVEALGAWTSPHTAAVYPSGWRLHFAESGEQLELRPRLVDQELFFAGVGGRGSGVGEYGANVGLIPYWEGAVLVSGDRTGLGYVELTGYAAR